MLRAWERDAPLHPSQSGGRRTACRERSRLQRTIPHIEYLGRQTREEVFALMREATLLVFPSIVYENMSLTILEAFATGLPVVASNLGSMATMIRHGETGWLFPPNDPMSLREAVLSLWGQHEQLRKMGRNARAEYLNHYTAERNYELLIAIYERAIRERTKEGRRESAYSATAPAALSSAAIRGLVQKHGWDLTVVYSSHARATNQASRWKSPPAFTD
jgi:hypothetical protein